MKPCETRRSLRDFEPILIQTSSFRLCFLYVIVRSSSYQHPVLMLTLMGAGTLRVITLPINFIPVIHLAPTNAVKGLSTIRSSSTINERI